MAKYLLVHRDINAQNSGVTARVCGSAHAEALQCPYAAAVAGGLGARAVEDVTTNSPAHQDVTYSTVCIARQRHTQTCPTLR
jgi:3-keto-L-gulonate-6-phosphate decarboxylase